MRVVRIFIMVARCSKYDFRNLGIIWDRNRWSENFVGNFSSKKIRKLLVGKFLGPTFFRFLSDFFVEKINEKSGKIFEIFEKIFDFSLTFSTKNFRTKNRKMFPKKSDQKFSDFFRRKFFRPCFFGSPISIPNDPKIPKIILRTACDHYKNTNNAHEKCFVLDVLWRPSAWWILCTVGQVGLTHNDIGLFSPDRTLPWPGRTASRPRKNSERGSSLSVRREYWNGRTWEI